LRCSGCNELKELPELTHTELTVLHISVCKKLTYIPDLPEALDYLTAAELPRLTQLPALPGRAFKAIHLANSNIVALPDPLPFIDMLICKKTRIRRLPPLAGCEFLCLDDCQQLQQLPKQLPDDLRSLNLAGCAALQQLPAELPSQLTTLDISGCTALQQLPARLPMSLVRLNAEGCSSLQQLPALAGCGLKELRIKGCVQLRGVDVAGCGDLVVQFD
jgi:Leucine-rich repeat (LRR) protein